MDNWKAAAAAAASGRGGAELLVQQEFLVPDPRKEQEVKKEEDQTVQGEGGGGGEGKGHRGKKDRRNKGQNKNRPPPMKFDRSERVCPILVNVTALEPLPKCTFPNCSFQHDLRAYVEKKASDIGEECFVYKEFGRCPRGVTCRFGAGHIDVEGEDVRNKEDLEVSQKWGGRQTESNHLSKELQLKLRKNNVDFKRCDEIVESFFKQRETERADEVTDKSHPPLVKKAKIEVDEVDVSANVVEGKEERKKIDWHGKLYLAPLTTVGNLPFRRICKSFGVDITCGEMAMGLQLLQAHQPEWALVQRHHSEDVFGVQLCGSSPQQMTRVAQVIEDHVDCDFVDINLGCPIDLVFKRGMGSGLMGRRKPLEVMVRAMSRILSCPLTVKMRTGIYADKSIAHHLIPSVREWGADMVTLHGRSREQRYTRLADWSYIGECVKVARPMAIFGNGDVMNYEDYNEQVSRSGVDGVVLARGALIKPWIFREIKEQRHWDISAGERLDMIRDYANFGLEHWGSDDKGVETTRRFLLEWLSFLHRYVPHGILVEPPQRINQRVCHFKGRNEMETLLSSPNCTDWIKITEMFLGKVPDSFSFQPKHRAHAY